MAARNGFRDFSSHISSYVRSIDLTLLIATVALAVAGVVNLWGVGGADHILLKRQMIFVVSGVGIMVLFSFTNWRYLRNWSLPVMLVYGLAVTLLAITLLFPEIRGIRAWIVLGMMVGGQRNRAQRRLLHLMVVHEARHLHREHLRRRHQSVGNSVCILARDHIELRALTEPAELPLGK